MRRLLVIVLWMAFIDSYSQEFSERYELVNLGRKVNTGYHEGGPVISADGKTLYFFVHNHPDNTYGKEGSQDIWVSKLSDEGVWGPAEHLGKPLNQHHSNQVFTVMPDGNTLFIRGGSSRNSKGFSFTTNKGGSWSNAEEINVEDFKKMNLGKFYGASMSSDGKHMLIYLSEKENSAFSDIYLSNKVDEKNWTRPVKLGTNINTPRDEFAPFIAPDDKTMYYSSNRKDMGIGGADIYKVTRKDDTWLNWTDPVNVGRPLNTRAFDSYMSIDGAGMVFTAQSGSTVDGGNLDIFWLNERPVKIELKGVITNEKTQEAITATIMIKKDGQPLDTLNSGSGAGSYETKLQEEGDYTLDVSAEGYFPKSGKFSLNNLLNDTIVFKDFALKPLKKNVILSGTVYDAKTNQPISSNVVANLRSNSKIGFKKKTDEGYYENELEKTGWYILTASAEGYLNATDSIESVGGEVTLLSKDFYLDPIEVGSTVRLNNIFFDFDKTTLKSESFVELDKVVDFLNNNNTVEIEIAGHTDSKGSDDYNLNLSQGRAQAVVDYLIQNGIDNFRLIAKGYGESVPVETNETDEGRAVNRRVEFTVLRK